MRIQKPGAFIEVFIRREDQSIRVSSGPISIDPYASSDADPEGREIARYQVNESKTDIAFFVVDSEQQRTVTADELAKIALEDFLFNPFPVVMNSASVLA